MIDRKYTILYFLDYGKFYGGAANTLLQQAILMKEAGHRIIVFVSDYQGRDIEKGYAEVCCNFDIELKWATYQISSHTEDIDIVCLNRNYEKMKNEIILYHPDILHSIQINPSVELLSRELAIPHIMNIYQISSDFFKVRYMNIFPHYHICDSKYYAQRWNKYLKTDSACIRTVVRGKESKKESIRKENLKFICVGSLCNRKNQLNVIKAFHKALLKGVRGTLTLYGYDGDQYADGCKKYIFENKLYNQIVVHGFETDMKEVYKGSDVLICGSTRESYPNVISEAMANDLLIISTPVAGVPEIIQNGKNGYLTENYTENALCEKILQLYSDLQSGKAEEIIENARQSFKENHSSTIVAEQIQQFYGYVIDDYKKKRNIISIDEVSIETIRESFRNILQQFVQKESLFADSNKVALKLWYIYHIQAEMKAASLRNGKFYIWGTGKYGHIVKEIVDVFFPEIQIQGFLDSYKEGSFEGHNIYRPEEVLKMKDSVILVAIANGQDEIIETLKNNNKDNYSDYFIFSPRVW